MSTHVRVFQCVRLRFDAITVFCSCCSLLLSVFVDGGGGGTAASAGFGFCCWRCCVNVCPCLEFLVRILWSSMCLDLVCSGTAPASLFGGRLMLPVVRAAD